MLINSSEVMVMSTTKTHGPRYQQITDQFRDQVKRGEMKPGDRLPSFGEMRSQFGASQATMDRVFSLLEQDGLISREPGRGTFVTEPSRHKKSDLIGFVGTDFTVRQRYAYCAHIVEGIEEIVQQEGKRILLLNSDSPVGWDQVEGVLMNASDSAALEAIPEGLPCVAYLEDRVCGISVVADEFGGARQATQHLLALGHRRIAYLLQISVPWLRRRAAGYRDAFEEIGLEPKPGWVWDPKTQLTAGGYREWGYENVKAWLQRDWQKQGFTALMAQNDLAAAGAIEALREAGLQVPRDVSVVGYDGTEVCDYFSPRITTIDVPLREIGAVSMKLLMRRINGEAQRSETVMLPTRLKEGESTAPPASSQPAILLRNDGLVSGHRAAPEMTVPA